jgi:hypothetical protein
VGSVEVVVWETGTAGREILCPASHPPKNVSGFFFCLQTLSGRVSQELSTISRTLWTLSFCPLLSFPVLLRSFSSNSTDS